MGFVVKGYSVCLRISEGSE